MGAPAVVPMEECHEAPKLHARAGYRVILHFI